MFRIPVTITIDISNMSIAEIQRRMTTIHGETYVFGSLRAGVDSEIYKRLERELANRRSGESTLCAPSTVAPQV